MLSVQTNMLAWNAERQFKINTKKQAKSTEKLSSGYRINRAADDAAGLSISEKMRRQIRGLMQGSDNVQEGISLVQVADGALDEVVDLLQRINELSVKAYNGTNTIEDRKYIQEEITHSIKEIERIADTTTFNEIYVLKGNPTETVKIEADKVYRGELEEEVSKEIPDWLKSGIDNKLEIHNYSGLTQDMDGEMFKVDQVDANGKIISGKYYGSTDKGTLYGVYTYGGAWTATLDDNPTAKISFSGLTQCTDAMALHANMVNLLGSAISVPCGTCDDKFYGIGYGGTMDDGYSAYPLWCENIEGKRVGITTMLDVVSWKAFTNDKGEAVNCFDKIEELISTHAKDTTLTKDVKEQQVKDLAEEIAKKLCDESYKRMVNTTEYQNHFDRALKSGDYDIIIYDYRDTDKLSSMSASETDVLTSCMGKVKIPHNFLAPGTEVEEEHPLWIVCSAQFGDIIPIELPLLTVDTLNISGYDVARYVTTEIYSDAYKAKLEAWENAFHYQTITTPPTPERKEEREIPVITKATPRFNKDGEFQGIEYEWEKRKFTKIFPASPGGTKNIKVYDYPKPTPEEGDVIRTISYEPDSNRQIGDALDYVLRCRTMLGTQQNRLEHTYNNNQNKLENTTASESRIRDTDIAEEMVAYSNHNILLQAGTSMLSQANQYSELIMQLLR